MKQVYQDPQSLNFELTTRADKLHLLFNQSFPAVFVSMANATLLLLVLWPENSHQKLLVWFGAVIIASVIRTMLFVNYRFRVPNDDAILGWETPYFVTLILSALVWGLGGLWLVTMASAEDQLIIFFFLMGMAGGAISLYSAIRAVALTSVACVLLPATVWFLVFGEAALHYTALGSALFLISCLRSTKVLSTALHKSFLLGHELNHAKNQAEIIARTDYLTGLNNRGAFQELADIQVKYCERHESPASLIILDLDDFKRINDSYGHSTGDDALRRVSQLLKRNTRSSDICGRMGGEEFMIFLPNTDLEDAVIAAEKIRQALEAEPVQKDRKAVRMTASFGVATGIYNFEKLLSQADIAMYKAKEGGKNRVCRSANHD
jgi:diguanylate cyclase (GGDEF)-like protein